MTVETAPFRAKQGSARRRIETVAVRAVLARQKTETSCADAICRSVRIIRHATSLGGVESTLERRAAVAGQTHLPPGLLRLSVGCEHPDDLWRDLQQTLTP